MTGETITTVEDLKALPSETILRGASGQAYLILMGYIYGAGNARSMAYAEVRFGLPMTVLYRPDADTGPPESDETAPRSWVQYGARPAREPDGPAFRIELSLEELRYSYRAKPRDRQDYDLVQRTVRAVYGPWVVVDPADPYDWEKR